MFVRDRVDGRIFGDAPQLQGPTLPDWQDRRRAGWTSGQKKAK
jgi:hypothetical protein